jgi:hypothetical protein
MSSQNPFGSTVPPERPTNPTHFGGEGLYESKPDTQESLAGGQIAERPFWDFAKRNHLVTLAAVGAVVWMVRLLLRRSMGHG